MNAPLIPGKDYPAIACGVYVFNLEGKFLMLLRSEKARNDKHMWGIPGGLVEFGESIEQAIVRETYEETNLHITDIQLVIPYTHIIPETNSHFVSLIFKTRTYTGIPHILEAEKFIDLQWFSPNDLPRNISIVVRDSLDKVL